MDNYYERKEIARQSVTFDRIEKYINYVLRDLASYEKVLEKYKRENKEEKYISGLQYKIDNAKYVLGLINDEPNFKDYNT